MVSALQYTSVAALAIVSLLAPRVAAQDNPIGMSMGAPMFTTLTQSMTPTPTPVGASPTGSPPAAITPDSIPAPISPGFTPTGTGLMGSAGTGGASGPGAMSGPCPQEGMWNCLGDSAFQRCGSGFWSAAQAMPAGTQCQPGKSDALWAPPGNARRFSRRHGRKAAAKKHAA